MDNFRLSNENELLRASSAPPAFHSPNETEDALIREKLNAITPNEFVGRVHKVGLKDCLGIPKSDESVPFLCRIEILFDEELEYHNFSYHIHSAKGYCMDLVLQNRTEHTIVFNFFISELDGSYRCIRSTTLDGWKMTEFTVGTGPKELRRLLHVPLNFHSEFRKIRVGDITPSGKILSICREEEDDAQKLKSKNEKEKIDEHMKKGVDGDKDLAENKMKDEQKKKEDTSNEDPDIVVIEEPEVIVID